MAENITYNILIVHDNEIAAINYQEALQSTEEQSYTIHIVNNEHEAFLRIMEINPELVIACYESSEIIAQRIIKSLMNYPREQRPGVLVVGPNIDDHLLRQLMFMGALDYLVEPVPVNKLRIKVKNAISNFLFKREKEEEETKIKDAKELRELINGTPVETTPAVKIDIPLLKRKLEKFKNLGFSIDEKEIKQSKDSWLFLAQGPTPDSGNWKKTDTPNKWEWVWSEEFKETYSDEMPEYFFEGIEPKWAKGKWENGRWVMGGKTPALSVQNIGDSEKDIINFDNGRPIITAPAISIPSSLMDSLATTYLYDGSAKVNEILLSCHYSKADIEKVMPGIKELANELEAKKQETKKKTTSTEVFDRVEGIVRLDAGEWVKVPSKKRILYVHIPASKKYKNNFGWFEGEDNPSYDERKKGWIFKKLTPKVYSKASELPPEIIKFLIDNKLIESVDAGITNKEDLDRLIAEIEIGVSKKDNSGMPSLSAVFEAAQELPEGVTPINVNPSAELDLSPTSTTATGTAPIDITNLDGETFVSNISQSNFSDELKKLEKTVKISSETIFEKDSRQDVETPKVKIQKPVTKKRLSLYERAMAGEFKIDRPKQQEETVAQPPVQQTTQNTLSTPPTQQTVQVDQKDGSTEDKINDYFDMDIQELTNLWNKLGGQNFFTNQGFSTVKKAPPAGASKQIEENLKSPRRLNILNQAIEDSKRRLSNIQVTIIDILNTARKTDLAITNETLQTETFQLSYNYLVNQAFKDVKQVIKVALTNDKFDALIYPYFDTSDKLVGIAVFRKGQAKTPFTMNDKIICSALANSIKTAFSNPS